MEQSHKSPKHDAHLDSVFCSTGCLTREVVRRSREGLCLSAGPGRLASDVREDRRDAERFMDRLTSLLICATCSMALATAGRVLAECFYALRGASK